MEKELYKWQKECLNSWKNAGCRGIVDVTTGAGKSYFACAAILYLQDKFPNLRVRIVVPTLMLAGQWRNCLIQNTALSVGMRNGQVKNTPDNDATIYVVNSARYSISKHILSDFESDHPVLLIADECHHYSSTENSHIFDFIRYMNNSSDKYYSLGLSATPFSVSNREILSQYLGETVYKYHADDAVTDGIISPFVIFETALSFNKSEWDEYDRISLQLSKLYKLLLQEYPYLKDIPDRSFFATIHQLTAYEDDEDSIAYKYFTLTLARRKITLLARSRLLCARELISRLHADKRILVFCERIEQAESIKEILSQNITKRISMYHSNMTPDAKRLSLDNFRMHQTNILISCRALDEGMDVPDADVGIVLSSTSVERQRIQRLGRIIRRSDNKEKAALYYLYIKESSDDHAYISEIKCSNVIRMTYNTAENHFINPWYEDLASSVYKEYSKKMSDITKKEFISCIEEGIARHDWMYSPNEIEKKLQSETDNHIRNYYTVMKKISIQNLHNKKEQETF